MRDDQFAACRLDLDYGNRWIAESIHVVGLDPTLVQATSDYDVDDLDEAIAELDRLSQADAS